MTIQNTNPRSAGPFQGNGTTPLVMPFNWKVFSATDLVLTYQDAAGNVTVKQLGVDYTVTLNADQEGTPGGSITRLATDPVGTYFTITSGMPNTIAVNITSAGGAVINNGFDRLCIMIQQLANTFSSAIRGPVSDGAVNMTLPSILQRAGKLLSFDGSGNVIAVAPTTGTATQVQTDLYNAADLSKGVSMVGGAERVVANIAALRLLPMSGCPVAYAQGYYTNNDGGGGHYYYDSTDTTSADNGGTVIVASDGGRWKLSSIDRINIKQFGAKGDGTTNDTTAINNAIVAANAAGKPIYAPYGLYVVTPGALTVLTVGIYGPEAFFKAASAVDNFLLAINYTYRAGISNDTAAWDLDLGGFVDATGSSYVGTGLYIKNCLGSRLKVRKAINLKYGIHADLSWWTGAGAPQFVGNNCQFETDSCMVGFQITAGTDASAVPVDINIVDMTTSYNHKTSILRINSGTVSGHGDTHNNTFIFQDLEIGQTNSNGITLTGLTHNNQFIIRNMRGVNGTGVYGSADANSTNNFWEIMTWVPANWSFSTPQQVNCLRALDASTQLQGRSLYFGPDVATVIGTTIPCNVGDRIFRSNATSISNDGWVCTTAGTGYAGAVWTPTGNMVRAWVKFNGSTGAIIAAMNVNSVTRSAAGDYTVNFGTALTDADYVPMGMGGLNTTSMRAIVQPGGSTPPTTTACRIQTVSADAALADSSFIYVAFVGN